MNNKPKLLCEIDYEKILEYYKTPNSRSAAEVIKGEVIRAVEYWREDETKVKEIRGKFACQFSPYDTFDLSFVLEMIRQRIEQFITNFFHTYKNKELVNTK